jgi:subtilase family serine protease
MEGSMKLRTWALAALTFAGAAIGVSSASADNSALINSALINSALNSPVEFSGNVYHRAVCGHGAAKGMALCHAHVVTDSRGTIRLGKASPDLVGAPSGYGPGDLRSAYKVTALGNTYTTVAIVDAYGYPNAERDLGVYRAQYGLPACTTANGCFRKVNQNGYTTYPAANVGWEQETALDLDMASAMCPNCKILLVQANTASFGALATAVNTAARLGAHAISNSYGGGEYGSTYYEGAYNHPGVAVTASSGDSGYGVEFPASSPHVIAVGGTSLRRSPTSTRGWTESVWNGAGSGCSSYYAKPTWQTDRLCGRRTVADVSAVADPYTGVAVYGPTNSYSSGWMVFGGTSVAAPLVAGVYGANGGAVNYGSNPYANLGGLFDINGGSNGACGGSYLCTGGLGYDGPTGLGTPNGIIAF